MTKNRKLRVGLVFDDTLDSSDGVAQYVKSLGGWLSDQGHSVRYLVGETKSEQWHGGKIYSLAKNISVKFNGNQLTMPAVSSKQQIRQVIRDEAFDVLHVMVPYSPLMAARIIKNSSRQTATIGTFHIFPAGGLSRIGSKLLSLWLTPSLNRFDEIVSVSPPAAAFAKSAFGLNTVVVPNPVDVSRFRTSRVKESTDPQIVFLGRLVKRKGSEQLIRAFAQLRKTVPTAHLTIAGAGPQRNKLEKLVDKLGLSGQVRFLGYIDEADKPRLLAGADIACFPSLYGESFGIVLIEAMAAGARVVLGGDNPGYRSVLAEQPDLLVDPGDTDAFAKRLEQLLTDKNLLKRIQSWQNRAIAQYDINVVGRTILDMYVAQIAQRSKIDNN